GSSFRRPPFFRTKKVGLLGSTDSLRYAPWFDQSWTLIAHPCCRPKCKREPDWYFDMHRPECFRVEKKPWNHDYHAWLKRLQTPIFMQKEWPDIPMAVRYPIEHVEAEFASTVTGDLFCTNHCAYMIALAMMEGVEQIGLWGCQYAGNERGTQRESLLYWLGRFEQSGGRLVVPRRNNTLMTQPLYGYASHDDDGKLVPQYRLLPGAPPKVEQSDNPQWETPTQAQLDELLVNGEAPALDRRAALLGGRDVEAATAVAEPARVGAPDGPAALSRRPGALRPEAQGALCGAAGVAGGVEAECR
ncbi:MAG TPA: hypothetical protein VHM25_28415, partial [Polyangiaceae bacterium]|nr:hypothetical protein [Polyangiaceae bacterium]